MKRAWIAVIGTILVTVLSACGVLGGRPAARTGTPVIQGDLTKSAALAGTPATWLPGANTTQTYLGAITGAGATPQAAATTNAQAPASGAAGVFAQGTEIFLPNIEGSGSHQAASTQAPSSASASGQATQVYLPNVSGEASAVPPTGEGTPSTLAPALVATSEQPAAQATTAGEIRSAQAGGGAPKYVEQPGSPIYLASFTHADLGCNWMGVGGQVFDLNGSPATYVVAEVKGTLGGQSIDALSLTGAVTAYGPAGYEITLAPKPVDSSGALVLQFFDLTGNPVSAQIPLTTYNDCNKNSIIINMSAIQPTGQPNILYLPGVDKNSPSGQATPKP